MTDRFQILAGRQEKQWTIIRVTPAFIKTFLMRSNTTFHPEILFDWPPRMFHVLLEEHRKMCVKVMLSWMWFVFLLTCCPGQSDCLQVPGQAPSSPSSDWLRVRCGAGRAVPTPPIHRGVIAPASCMLTILMGQSRGYNGHFLPIFPSTAPSLCRPLFLVVTTIHPRPSVVPLWPGQAGHSLPPAPLRCLQTISAQSEADSREIQTRSTESGWTQQ